MTTPSVIILAKSPVAGRVKTRLTPPFTPEQAAGLAAAALRDTLRAARGLGARARVVLVLDGATGPWLDGFDVEVVPQRGDGLGDRITAAFHDVGGPAVLIGMDTPQVSPLLLARALDGLRSHDAVLGPAADGGYWTLGLTAVPDGMCRGVPMSASDTGARQLDRLHGLGLDVLLLPTLRDIDRSDDVHAVASMIPRSFLARALRPMTASASAAPVEVESA